MHDLTRRLNHKINDLQRQVVEHSDEVERLSGLLRTRDVNININSLQESNLRTNMEIQRLGGLVQTERPVHRNASDALPVTTQQEGR
ncbi:hypothetical protein F4776DRAFT_625794 [Hypoxylon sp. NC0597]|nr:hypothetical protein F4776DRAFT_625794 [Hypoxylon sp. NC0597]